MTGISGLLVLLAISRLQGWGRAALSLLTSRLRDLGIGRGLTADR